MKLQDYIKYYIGCKINKDIDALEYPTIKGIQGDRVIISEYKYRTENCKECFTRPEIFQYVGFVKPMLRRLENMTEEEARHIGKLAMFDREMNYPDSDYRVKKAGLPIDKPSVFAVSISNDWFEKEIRIGFKTGNVWYANNEINERVYNQPVIFHYLLQQHFDLFGLIDAGLAIDAKTINL